MVNKKLSFKLIVFSIISIMVLQTSCTAESPSDLSKESIIPKPVTITATGDIFELKSGADIFFQGGSEELERTGQYLAGILRASTGYEIEVKSTDKPPKPGSIFLTLGATGSGQGAEKIGRAHV